MLANPATGAGHVPMMRNSLQVGYSPFFNHPYIRYVLSHVFRFTERPSLTRAHRRSVVIREIRVFAADFCFLLSVFLFFIPPAYQRGWVK